MSQSLVQFSRKWVSSDYYSIEVTVKCFVQTRPNMLYSLVWFGLFVHPFSHTCNTGHVNYRLQFMYHNTTYNIWTATQYNMINNNTKFTDKLEVEIVTTSIYTGVTGGKDQTSGGCSLC